MREESVAALLDACVAGDPAAQARFFTRFQDLVARSVARTLARYSTQAPVARDVDDLAQEVFEKLLTNQCKSLQSVKGAATIDGWLVAVTRNHVIDALRNEGTRARAMRQLAGSYAWQDEPDPAPVSGDDSEELVLTLRSLVATLPTQQRLCLQFYYLDGMSYTQIAGIVGQPVNTVASHLHRARRSLALAWQEREGLAPAGELAQDNDHGY